MARVARLVNEEAEEVYIYGAVPYKDGQRVHQRISADVSADISAISRCI